MNLPASEFLPTRQSLLSRLKDWEDRAGWKEFFDTYWRLIYSVALKSGLTESEAEEVVQETIVAVAKQMPKFRYDKGGSFKAWLLQITRRRIVDQFRKRAPWDGIRLAGDDTTRTAPVERLPAPEPDLAPVWDEEWHRNLMEVALQRVKARVKPRQFQIFDLYVLKEWPVAEVTQSLNVNAAQVYLARHRVTRLVRDEVARLKKLGGDHDAELPKKPAIDNAP